MKTPDPGTPQTDLSPAERAERIRAIVSHPAYALAEGDTSFLGRPELCGVRLLLEYEKPRARLEQHEVRSTIVLFGSTRICDPAEARRRLAAARRDAAARPDDAVLAERVRIEERLCEKSRYHDVAREFAALASQCCQRPGCREFVIVTGGGPGIMEAGNRGACEAGHETAGFNIHLPLEQDPNPYITPGLSFRFHYFALRKMHFLRTARALVAFPGGFGTFDELFETLCLIQTGTIERLPVVLVGESFWRRAFDAQFLADEGVIDPSDLGLFIHAETAQEIWDHIERFYAERGIEIPGGSACETPVDRSR